MRLDEIEHPEEMSASRCRTRCASLVSSLLAALALVLLTFEVALAVNIQPANDYQKLVYTFDRGAGNQAQYNLYIERIGAHDTETPLPPGQTTPIFRMLNWQCQSPSDPAAGACREQNSGGITPITLRFTEKRSRLYIDLNLTGIKVALYGESGGMAGCYQSMGMSSVGAPGACRPPDGGPGVLPSGWSLNLFLPAGELNKLPTGGVWTAHLPLTMRVWRGAGSFRAVWTTDLEFNVTDKNNIEAYLPAFGNAAALVDLNLHTQPLTTAGGQVSGVANLDMCLYDGYNSNSTWYDVRVSDKLSVAGRPPDVFSVLNQDAGGNSTDPRNRVDYTVTMLYNGQPMTLRNGEQFRLPSVDTSLIRAVRIPNVTWPVVCTPTPLTLRTAAFNQLDKRAGRYQGVLSIVFTPSSESL